MPKEPKVTGELLSDTLLNVSCLIGEARDVCISLARDLSSADKLLDEIRNELGKVNRERRRQRSGSRSGGSAAPSPS
jgi:hypothetical protein